MTTAELIANDLLNRLADNELFQDGFCLDCPDGKVRWDEECPAAWDYTSPDCARCNVWSALEEAICECIEVVLRH